MCSDTRAEIDTSKVSPQELEVWSISTDASDHESECPCPVELERSTSQLAMQLQVNTVLQRLVDRKGAICRLQDRVSQLIDPKGCPDSAKMGLALIQELQKSARNYGEDLLEDMLSLDKLSGLVPEDRASRKVAIASLDALLEDVDKIKRDLVQFQKHFEVKQNQMEQKCSQEVHMDTIGQEAKPDPQCKQTEKHRSPVEHQARASHVGLPECLMKAPGRNMWRTQELSVEFASKELQAHYEISAALSNLDTNDVEVNLTDNGSVLTITGLRLPTALEMQHMQNHLTKRLQHVGHMFKGYDERAVAQLYASMGRGTFGHFSERFRLPRDVDVQRIQVSYKNGILSLNLPKKIRRAVPRFHGYGLASPR